MLQEAANDRTSSSHVPFPPILILDRLNPLRSRSQDLLSEHRENDVELRQLKNDKPKAVVKASRQNRREEKRRRKLRQLQEREEMKFSHSIQFNAVPDWSSHYISYSNLKKL